jgi:hypothetical protein
MHHSAHEPRPLTGWHTGQRADENSHPMCHVNALDVATQHASAHQEGNGDADVNWREKPAEQGVSLWSAKRRLRESAQCAYQHADGLRASRSRNRGYVPRSVDTNIARVARLLLDAWRARAQRLRRNTSRLIRKSPPGEMA